MSRYIIRHEYENVQVPISMLVTCIVQHASVNDDDDENERNTSTPEFPSHNRFPKTRS